MAILKGITVTIEVNGISVKEHRDHDDQEIRLNYISKQIESVSGAAFAIRVFIPKTFLFTSDAVGVYVHLDGTYAEGGIFERGLLHNY